MISLRLGLAAFVFGLSGCTYDVETMSAPQLNISSTYKDRVPSKWALVVETGSMSAVARSSSLSCSAHAFPVDLAPSFRPSVTATFQNMTQQIDVLDQPLTADELEQKGYAGLIRVRGESVKTQLDFLPGFWTETVDATIYLEVGVLVESAGGRVLGTLAAGVGRAQGGAGVVCEGAAAVLGKASEDAIRAVLGRVAERFANEPRIREVARERELSAGGI